MKVLAACGSGMGSSQIIKMKITNVFKKLNIPLEIHCTPLTGSCYLHLRYRHQPVNAGPWNACRKAWQHP